VTTKISKKKIKEGDFLIEKKSTTRRQRTPQIDEDTFSQALEIAAVLAPGFKVNKYQALAGAVSYAYEVIAMKIDQQVSAKLEEDSKVAADE
jgi:hypothetical protein